MIDYVLTFFLGAFIGVFLGFVIMAVAASSGRNNKVQEAYEAGYKDGSSKRKDLE